MSSVGSSGDCGRSGSSAGSSRYTMHICMYIYVCFISSTVFMKRMCIYANGNIYSRHVYLPYVSSQLFNSCIAQSGNAVVLQSRRSANTDVLRMLSCVLNNSLKQSTAFMATACGKSRVMVQGKDRRRKTAIVIGMPCCSYALSSW